MTTSPASQIRCVLHGSFGKHFDLIQKTSALFTAAGIEVLAPKLSTVIGSDNGFALLEGEAGLDPRLIELQYLHHLKRLGSDGFSYYVNPEGYIGKSASYELGIAQTTNVRCFFLETPQDHPAYIHANSVWSPENIAAYVAEHGSLPEPTIARDEHAIHQLWEDLMVPGSVVATGGIIEHEHRCGRRDILLVKTHKWGGRYSIVGGKVRRNETLQDALVREVKEETGLSGIVDRHLCTFDQIKHSGYYRGGVQHIFVDNIFKVSSKRVTLNDEAQDYVWMPAHEALRDLPIEPNARHVVELYAAMTT